MKNITKKITRISTVLTASILSAALPLTALAAQNSPDDNTYQPKDVQTVDYKKSLTPEFAYSAEKWATLRDNIMEYGELADLIHEYNPTVLSNRSTYKDQKNKNLNDIYDDYMKDIDDIWDQADNADNDVTWASLRYSAGLLTKQADNNYEDAEMEKIQYDQQEAKLVYQRSSAAAVRSNPGSDVRRNGNPDRCPYSFKECTGSGYSHFNSKKEPGKCTQKSVPYVRLERRCTA